MQNFDESDKMLIYIYKSLVLDKNNNLTHILLIYSTKALRDFLSEAYTFCDETY